METEDLKCHSQGLVHGGCPLPILFLLSGLSTTAPPATSLCSHCQQSDKVAGRLTCGDSHLKSRPSEKQNIPFCQHQGSKGSFQSEDTSFPTSAFPPSQSRPLPMLPRPGGWDFRAPRKEDWLGHRVPFFQPSPQLGQGG